MGRDLFVMIFQGGMAGVGRVNLSEMQALFQASLVRRLGCLHLRTGFMQSGRLQDAFRSSTILRSARGLGRESRKACTLSHMSSERNSA
jgi:hypothetical protein